MEKKFTYADPELLNFLTLHLTENTEFNAILMPNVPELIQIWRAKYYEIKGKHPRFEQRIVDPNINYNHVRAAYIARLCVENGIKPFWQLRFAGGINPEVHFNLKAIVDQDKDETFYDKVRELFKVPDLASSSEKWNEILFDEIEPRNTSAAKKGIKKLIEQGYIVTYVSAHLNPNQGISDHYFGRFEYDGYLHARDGRIFFESKELGDFDPTMVPRKFPQDLDEEKDRVHRLEKIANEVRLIAAA